MINDLAMNLNQPNATINPEHKHTDQQQNKLADYDYSNWLAAQKGSDNIQANYHLPQCYQSHKFT